MADIARRYAHDTYFLETCDALAEAGVDAATFADRHGLMLLKPDAAITGTMRPTVAWLLEHGYRIVGAHSVQFTPLRIRALWYFSWQNATAARRRLADRLAGLSPSLVLVITHSDDTVPVSARLTADKGPADPAQRTPAQLRYVLGAGTYLLNLIHTPDDPEDVLRELSIYFAEPELREVISACTAGADASSDAIRFAELIESGVERRSADLTVAQDAIWKQLKTSGMTEKPRSGDEWLRTLDDAARRGICLDTWFRIVIESSYRPMHRL